MNRLVRYGLVVLMTLVFANVGFAQAKRNLLV